MALGLGFQGAVLGIGVETEWGTAVARTVFLELTSDGLQKDIEQLHSEAIPAIYMDDDEYAQGGITISGDIEFEMRYQGMETLFKNAMGSVSTAETASYTVDATNNKLDFNIGSSELTATIASGTYIAGTDETTADSLCKAIYDAIVAAEAVGTYTVDFSSATGKFTIVRSAGTFQILWKTGTNGADGNDVSCADLLGYSDAADDTGALTYVSDTATVPVFTHTFSLADALPTGLTLEVDRDVTAFTYEGCKINTMDLSIEMNGFLKCALGIIGEDVNTGTATAQSLPTAPLVVFSEGAVTYGGSSKSVKNFSLNLNNNIDSDRRYIGSRLISEPQRTAKIEVTGTMTIDFDSTTEYGYFVAATEKAITLTFTSTDVLKTGTYYSIVVTIPIVKLTASAPKVENEGAMQLEMPFKAYATDSSTREFTVAITNALVTVA